MGRNQSSLTRIGVASGLALVASLASANAFAADACPGGTTRCTSGTAALKAEIKTPLPTVIDSGWMDKGQIKIRTRFTISPVGSDPVIAIAMPTGALVEASWTEKGFIDVRPLTAPRAEGKVDVHYQLAPSLEASIYGINVAYNANALVNMVPGARFNYDSRGSSPIVPWGFAGASVTTPAPRLDQSTLMTLPFTTLGVGTGTAEGTLAIQAAANPTFKYVTKSVRIDQGTVQQVDGSARINTVDADFLDVLTTVTGELTLSGNLDVRPVVKVDSVAGYPTFGVTKFSFDVVSKPIAGEPMPIAFESQVVHIPLPNVKVPSAGMQLGEVKAGTNAKKTVTIENTGELPARFTFASTDPQFTGPSGDITIGAKGRYDLELAFAPNNGGAAKATITISSNDPDSPEQSFEVGANGAVVGGGAGDDSDGASGRKPRGYKDGLDPLPSDEGCAVANVGTSTSPRSTGLAFVGLGAAAMILARRRRAAR